MASVVTAANRDKDDIDIDIEVTFPATETGKSGNEVFRASGRLTRLR